LSKYFPENARVEKPTLQTIPGSIVKAISRIAASLDAVSKTGKNAHGGYMFASTDDIYAAITRKLGEVGLVIMPLEEHIETSRVEKDGKTNQWLKAVYSFALATEEATWHDPRSRRTLFLQITGPQSFQSAASYAEKAYLRSLFKIPSGEFDLDSMPQANTEDDQVALSSSGAKRKSSYGAKKDGTDALFNEINRHIQGASDAGGLQYVRSTYADEWARMPARWVEMLDDAYEHRMSDIQVRHNGQGGN
jgi:hypothetical protein